MEPQEPEPEEIRRDIDQTRASLTEKIGALGDHLTQTVEETRVTVEETIDSVRSTVEETVETVRHTFDVRYQVRKRPWLLMGGAVAVGFALEKLLTPRAMRVVRRRVESAVEHAADAVSSGATYAGRRVARGVRSAGEHLAASAGATLAAAVSHGHDDRQPPEPGSREPGFMEKLLQGPLNELDELKKLGVEAAKSFAITLAVENLPHIVTKAVGLVNGSDHPADSPAPRATAGPSYRPNGA
jgi:ElaB/YqjD/DUF883 family membrane-anchored ribosome-binding protein